MTTVPRLPLQTGHGAARSLLAAALYFAPGALLWPLFLFGGAATSLPASDATALIMVVWVLSGVLSLAGVRQAQRAWLARASDVLLTADSLEFVGGTHGGFSLPLRDATPTSWKILTRKRRVELTMPDDDEVMTLAATTSHEEAESFGDLLETVLDACSTTNDAPPAAVASDVLTCSGCGAMLVPAVATTLRCHRCGASTAVPAEMVKRLSAAQEVSALTPANDRALAALFRQPTAPAVNRALLAAALGIGVSVTTTLLLSIAATRAGTFGAVGMARMAMPVAVAIGLLSVARLPLADRRAVHLLAMHGSAIAPVAPGEPFSCRTCGAPLPAARDRIVVACVYCDSANVLAVSLRKRFGTERSLRSDLTAALTERASRRRVAWVGGILGAALTFLAIAATISAR